MTDAAVGVVVLAWQGEPWLEECLDAVLASTGVDVHLIVVDNGCTRADFKQLVAERNVRVLTPGVNTGFAGGCNLGAAALTTDYLALVNSDCAVAPHALAQLVAEARNPDVGPVMASVRHADRPELINSAGNPVHILGVSWAGGLDESETRTAPFDVTGASGAALLLRRSLWLELGGFDETYFAYLEDTELSLRCLRIGLRARCVPTATARHHYEFSRNATKMYLLERNRLMLLVTMWPLRALVMLAPLIVALECGILVQAISQGWGKQKVRAWYWICKHRKDLRRSRNRVRTAASVPDTAWMTALTPRLDPHVIGSTHWTKAVNGVVAGYWWWILRWI